MIFQSKSKNGWKVCKNLIKTTQIPLSGLNRISKETEQFFFFIYKLSDILLQSSLIYSERFQIFLVQLYLIYIHILHPYMYTFKYISKCTNCCCNFVLQKLDSEIIKVFFFFFQGCYISTDINTNHMGLSLWEKKKSFNPSGTLLLTEST